MNKSVKRAFSVVFFVFITISSQAANPTLPTTGIKPPCWPPPCIPIDGGIIFLAVAGLALATKILYNKRRVKSVVGVSE